MACRGCRPPLNNRLSSSCTARSEEHTSELHSHVNLVCRLLLEKKKRATRARTCAQGSTRSGEEGARHARRARRTSGAGPRSPGSAEGHIAVCEQALQDRRPGRCLGEAVAHV